MTDRRRGDHSTGSRITLGTSAHVSYLGEHARYGLRSAKKGLIVFVLLLAVGLVGLRAPDTEHGVLAVVGSAATFSLLAALFNFWRLTGPGSSAAGGTSPRRSDL